jgi:hypothetical protein
VKFDGYRMRPRVQDGKAGIRKGLGWMSRFPAIAKTVDAFMIHPA